MQEEEELTGHDKFVSSEDFHSKKNEGKCEKFLLVKKREAVEEKRKKKTCKNNSKVWSPLLFLYGKLGTET